MMENNPIADIIVEVKAVLSTHRMSVAEVLKLSRGSVITFERKINEPIDIYVNDKLIARGEVIIIDGKLGVTMTEMIKT